MSTFAVAEPVAKKSAETYAQALMMIMLCFGLAHTVVLDKDSKFHDTFRKSCQLLNINTHTISQKNHNAMIVERLNEYFDKGIKIFANKQGTPAVSRESVLMLVVSMAAAKPAEAARTPSPSLLMARMVPTEDRLFSSVCVMNGA